jgi:hypothetical protein
VESKDQPGQVAHQVREVLKVNRDPVGYPDPVESKAQQGQVEHRVHKVFKAYPVQVEGPEPAVLQGQVVTPEQVESKGQAAHQVPQVLLVQVEPPVQVGL